MSRRILIVDDADINREVLENLLSPEYDTVQATGGQEAIAIIEKERDNLSLVLLDIMMPDIDGYEVLKSMHFNGTIKHTPAILITAADSIADEEKGLSMGAADFIRKPFVPEIVLHRVKNILELYGYQNDLETVLEEKAETLSNINEIIVAVLTSVLETKTPESREHLLRVRLYTRELLKYIYDHCDDEYGLTPQSIETMCMASVLHDIGELLIPDRILGKPLDEMSNEEKLIWQQHTIKGCQLIEPMKNIENRDYIKFCYNICRSHHEKWDGSGFPDRIGGEDIPICAQAVGIAHRYDHLTIENGYTHEQALRRLTVTESGAFTPVMRETMQLVSDSFREIHDKNPEPPKRNI